MIVPPDWRPGHPGYPLHLARVQLRSALAIAETVLEMIGADDPKATAARALWDLAMENDAARAANVVPLAPAAARVT